MYELKADSSHGAGPQAERENGVIAAAALPWAAPALGQATPLFYARSLWHRKLWLIGLSLLGATLGIGAVWMRTPTYCARTVLRPIPAPELVSASQFSLAGGLLGLGGKTETEAYRYISIITSHQFLFRLIDEHRLIQSGELSGRGWLKARRLDRWGAYRLLKRAMEVQFDRRQGNILIDLRLRNRGLAENLLVWIIGDLREQLRKGVIDECAASNTSLEDQARRTPDDIVRQEIYQQVAYDLQRAALAKVQADFAFAVIDPPLADDQPADLAPWAVASLIALVVLMLGMVTVWSYDYLALLKRAERRSTDH